MKNQRKKTADELAELRKELTHIRTASLLATRKGDYMRVARLTVQASELHKQILEREGLFTIVRTEMEDAEMV